MLAKKSTSQSKQNKENQPEVINWKDLPINSQNNTISPNPNSPTYQTQTNAFPESQYQRVEPTKDETMRWEKQGYKLNTAKRKDQIEETALNTSKLILSKTVQYGQENPFEWKILHILLGSGGGMYLGMSKTKNPYIIIASTIIGGSLSYYLSNVTYRTIQSMIPIQNTHYPYGYSQ